MNHGESVPRREDDDVCRRCRCNDGEFECSMPDGEDIDCRRSDPNENERPSNCMMGEEMVMHNEQREVSFSRAQITLGFL